MTWKSNALHAANHTHNSWHMMFCCGGGNCFYPYLSELLHRYGGKHMIVPVPVSKGDSRFVPSQWEMSLQISYSLHLCCRLCCRLCHRRRRPPHHHHHNQSFMEDIDKEVTKIHGRGYMMITKHWITTSCAYHMIYHCSTCFSRVIQYRKGSTLGVFSCLSSITSSINPLPIKAQDDPLFKQVHNVTCKSMPCY